jgi:hypothetical protein
MAANRPFDSLRSLRWRTRWQKDRHKQIQDAAWGLGSKQRV